MHRRDYKVIASVLKRQRELTDKQGVIETQIVDDVISAFCLSLKEENHSFNEQKFRDFIKKGK
jgi:hypothetical protein